MGGWGRGCVWDRLLMIPISNWFFPSFTIFFFRNDREKDKFPIIRTTSMGFSVDLILSVYCKTNCCCSCCCCVCTRVCFDQNYRIARKNCPALLFFFLPLFVFRKFLFMSQFFFSLFVVIISVYFLKKLLVVCRSFLAHVLATVHVWCLHTCAKSRLSFFSWWNINQSACSRCHCPPPPHRLHKRKPCLRQEYSNKEKKSKSKNNATNL